MHWHFGGRGQRWQLTGVHLLTQAGVGEAAADWDEAVMAGLPFMPNSTVGLHFYGILGFLQQYSWLWSSSLLSPQACLQATNSSPFLGSFLQTPCSTPHRHTTCAPVHIGRCMSEAEVRRVTHSPPVDISLCPACHRPAAALSSRPQAPPSV